MKIHELKFKKTDIICLKNQGFSLREIAETFAPEIDNATPEEVATRVKTIWDNYIKSQKKILEPDDEDKLERPIFSPATAERQTISENAAGEKESDLTVRKDKLKKELNAYNKEELLELHGFVPASEWELISAKSSKWEAQAGGGDIIEMVSSKVSAAPVAHESELLNNIIKEAEQKFGPIGKRRHPVPLAQKDAGEIAIAAFPDFHLDKREGSNSYMSFETQVQRFYAMVDWYYNQFKVRPHLEKIAFYWSQDFFNYDYMTEETTSRRNKQDSIAGYNKMVSTGNILLVNAILKLEELAPVELFYTRSNHDQHTAFNTMCSLYCSFRNDENIIIDGMTAAERDKLWQDITSKQINGLPVEYDNLFDTAGRHYIMWGNTLLGFAHGDTEGTRLHTVMQTEADKQFARLYAKKNGINYSGNINSLPEFPEKFAWSKTLYHVFFCGHFHSKQKLVNDNSGVEVIYLGTEMTGDAWHENCGYIGAQRRIEAYIYNKRGEYTVTATQAQVLKEDWEKANDKK